MHRGGGLRSLEKDPPGKALDLRLVCESDVIGMLVGGGGGQSRRGDMMNGRDREGCSTGEDSGQVPGDNIPGYLIV